MKKDLTYLKDKKEAAENEKIVEFQRATMRDEQTLLDIEKTTIGLKTYSGYYQEEEIKDYINNDVVYLIKKDGKIVGSISYEIKNKDHAYESGLVIKPEFQKQGLAKRAMLKLLEELNNFKYVDLVVHPENTSAVKLYKSLGFVERERKENFYGDGEPRIIMILNKEK